MPFPDYFEIQEDRKRKLRQEIEGGRQRVMENIAQSWLERVRQDYRFASIELNSTDPDPRKWTMAVSSKKGEPISAKESFWEFPSDEFITKLMLLGLVE